METAQLKAQNIALSTALKEVTAALAASHAWMQNGGHFHDNAAMPLFKQNVRALSLRPELCAGGLTHAQIEEVAHQVVKDSTANINFYVLRDQLKKALDAATAAAA